MTTEDSKNFTPLFELPPQLNIPRTKKDLILLAQDPFFEGNALRQHVTDAVEANANSLIRSLVPACFAICAGSLQTPEYLEGVFNQADLTQREKRISSELRLGRSMLLLAKKVPQEVIVRAGNIDKVPTDMQPALPGQLEYILQADRAYDFLKVRVLPAEAERQLGTAMGAIVTSHQARGNMFKNGYMEDAHTKAIQVAESSLEGFEKDILDRAFDLCLSEDDSRVWLQTTLEDWQPTA